MVLLLRAHQFAVALCHSFNHFSPTKPDGIEKLYRVSAHDVYNYHPWLYSNQKEVFTSQRSLMPDLSIKLPGTHLTIMRAV